MSDDENKQEVNESVALNKGKQDIITDFSLVDLSKLYNYTDYLKWHFEERVELIKGKIFKMSPAPTSFHQQILTNLLINFGNYLKSKSCKVFPAPFDVRFPNNTKDKNPYTVVQPDICVICDPNKIDKKGCMGTPDLIIEILSPSSATKDINIKYHLYEEHGVKEYWIIDPLNKILDVFILGKNGKFQLLQKFHEGEKVKVTLFPELVVNLNGVFND